MHRSSESIGAIAAALAKAQAELSNPEKSLIGIIGPSTPQQAPRTFRYRSGRIDEDGGVEAKIIIARASLHA
jgi:hypothetical protein